MLEKTKNSDRISISNGNVKLGKIPNFSLTPGASCSEEACRTCLHDCYAMKAYIQYPGTRNAWNKNTNFATQNPVELFKQMFEYLDKKKPKFFRVHVAGDFVSLAYAEVWSSLGKCFPETKFLAFTKRWDIVDDMDFPDNFTIIYSAWPGCPSPPNTRQRAWMQDGTEKRIPSDALPCPGNCTECGMCWSLPSIRRDVYFDKH